MDPRSNVQPSFPGCSSKDLEKLVLVFKKVKFVRFLQDSADCPWSGDCLNAGSVKCGRCHRKVTTICHHLSRDTKLVFRSRSSGENYCQFKDREYYQPTEPFVEVSCLFEPDGGIK